MLFRIPCGNDDSAQSGFRTIVYPGDKTERRHPQTQCAYAMAEPREVRRRSVSSKTTRRHSSTCHHCQRTFCRVDHLQRHLLTHSDVAAHQCPRCQRPFKRKDALTRHTLTCPHEPSLPAVNPNHACYRCANKKIACSHDIPSCKSCSEVDQPCRYPVQSCKNQVFYAIYSPAVARISPDSGFARVDTSVVDIEQSDSTNGRYILQDCSAPTVRSGGVTAQKNAPVHQTVTISLALKPHSPTPPPATSFLFLVHFTRKYSLTDCFSTRGNAQIMRSDDSRLAEGSTQSLDDSTIVAAAFLAAPSTHFLPQPGLQSQWLICDSASQSPADQFLRQMDTLNSIAEKSWSICSALQKCSPSWSDSQEWCCLEFFSPDRIVSALELYWSMWHPNWPVLHRPSFSIEETPTPLLAAMVVVGSCHDNLDSAQSWFDVVEDLAFRGLLLPISDQQQPYRRIQNIQAAYLTCIYQTWDGAEADRTRIRRHRFRDIVTAVRELDLSLFKHDMDSILFEDFDWPTFVRQEESIRTLLWVFLLDTAYVIFNNVPPHFALRELSMGLASCEASYQASSSRTCFHHLRDWRSHNVRPVNLTLYGLIKVFFKQELDKPQLDQLAHESFMNLWCVVSAFHVLLFNIDPALGGEGQLVALQTGIGTWESVWQQRLRNNDEQFFDPIITTAALTSDKSDISDTNAEINIDLWQKPGFWKNAAEYWLLARVILERMMAAHRSATSADELSGTFGLHLNIGPYVHGGGEHADMRNLHSFLLAVGKCP